MLLDILTFGARRWRFVMDIGGRREVKSGSTPSDVSIVQSNMPSGSDCIDVGLGITSERASSTNDGLSLSLPNAG